MNDNLYVKYSFLITEQLNKFNRFKDYQDGYRRMKKIRKRLGLTPRAWDCVIEGSDNVPLSIYKRTLHFVRNLVPTNKTQTEIAIDSFKHDLSNHKRVIVE